MRLALMLDLSPCLAQAAAEQEPGSILSARDQTCCWGANGYSVRGLAVVTSCQITLTQNHMAELRNVYADAFQ